MIMRWLALCVLLTTASAMKIVTQGETFTVNEQETVELPCHIQDVGEDDTLLWKRNEDPIFVDDEQLSVDERYSVIREKSNYTLIIKSVEPIDNAEFTCAVTDPVMQVTHKVVVHSPPVVSLSPDSSIYNVNVGETNVIIRCHVKGNPTPSVKWERKDAEMPTDIKVRHQHIVISKAKLEHSGEYACTAKNVAGSDSASLTVNVNEPLKEGVTPEAPWVEMTESFIPVRTGQEVEILCNYDGTPAPQPEWLYNGYKINFSEKKFKNAAQYAKRVSNHSVSTLVLLDISEEVFGDYTCRASNNLGHDQDVVHVSGRPGPPELSVDESNLSWKVRASEPILEYRVYFRLEKQDDWAKYENIRVHKSDKTGADYWEHEVSLLPFVEAGVTYQLQLKARNALGWGSFAKDYATVSIPANQEVTAASSYTCVLLSSITSLLIFVL